MEWGDEEGERDPEERHTAWRHGRMVEKRGKGSNRRWRSGGPQLGIVERKEESLEKKGKVKKKKLEKYRNKDGF